MLSDLGMAKLSQVPANTSFSIVSNMCWSWNFEDFELIVTIVRLNFIDRKANTFRIYKHLS